MQIKTLNEKKTHVFTDHVNNFNNLQYYGETVIYFI